MTFKHYLIISAHTIIFAIAPAQTQSVIVFSDSFNGDMSGGDTNADINSNYQTRQSGTTQSDYNYSGVNGGGAFLNKTTGGPFDGQTSLLLRGTHKTDYSSASNAYALANTNFGSALAGKTYTIRYNAYFSQSGSTNIAASWGSFMIADEGNPVATPTSPSVDYALMCYQRIEQNNLSLRKDTIRTDHTLVDGGGNSLFAYDNLFTVEITVNEGAGTVDTVFNKGLLSEHILATESINFENNTDRYFGFRINLGNTDRVDSTRDVDFHIDDFEIAVQIPEASHFALLMGSTVIVIGFIKRRHVS